ncbi:hypothetical protein Kpho02_06410 [Kitasatospora phosalacinea]|uniref:Uncharacterized protein n=1 Tax=Kitasatospora phosalacinea TaxID=2065 RepID=A0A9W6V0K4_9ACTN|nr:hypothetical protein [Kitasatospora phosalacinea]GLW68342.1 hypothetical protein Kpho02_06410 [Kitasatospora phosalacinea]
MRNDGGRVLRWAGHPGTLLAIAVLAFNDRVGKRAWPGAVTGKVSDAAWMLVVPPLLALLVSAVPRLRGERAARLGVALTALTFGCAKSSAAGAELASHGWSLLTGVPSRTVADRTDLLALPVLAVAWWLWRRSARPRPLRRALALVAVPLAVLATAATSAATVPEAALWSEDGRPVLYEARRWTSEDGGLTWRLDPGSGKATAPPAAAEAATAADGLCLPEDPHLCFRAPGYGLPVEVSRDGRASWQAEYLPPEVAPLEGTGTPVPSAGAAWSPAPSAATASPLPPTPCQLVLAAVPGGGHTVVVRYPHHGLQVRTADGRWTAVPLPPRPDPAGGDGVLRMMAAVPLSFVAGTAAVLTGLGARRLRAGGPSVPAPLLWRLALRTVLPFCWLAVLPVLHGDRLPWLLWLVGAMALPWTALLWRRPPFAHPGHRNTVALLGAGALVGAVTFLHVVADSGARLPWSTSCLRALGYALAGSVVTTLVGGLPRAPRSGYPPWQPPSAPGGAPSRGATG